MQGLCGVVCSLAFILLVPINWRIFFVPFAACGFVDALWFWRGFVLTDHNFSMEQLEHLRQQIASGHPPRFEIDDDSKQQIKAALNLLGAKKIVAKQERSLN